MPGLRGISMKLAMATLLAVFVAGAAVAQLAEADQHWAARAEGSQNGHAKADQVNAAIAAYQKAIAADPNDLEPQWKLLRALRFKGAYVANSNDEKKQVYAQAKTAGDAALKVLDKKLAAKGINSVSKATETQVAEVAKTIPGAAEMFLWDSINWGEWALAYGKLAAAREGAADRIRREATIANIADPKLEGGSPSRVLGRLHDQTPRIPFITGWASSRDAVRFLNDSLKVDPANKITIVFLAEAMVNNNSDTRPQAMQMLKNAVSAPVDQTYVVEQTAALNDAKTLLRKWSS
jgi:tetratricopeptide (TPR) repeat protein